MAPNNDIIQKTEEDSPTEKELKETHVVLTSFLRALKNFSLYPPTHINCKAGLDNFHTQLDNYLKNHGTLRFEFTETQLIFKGKVILSEPREEGNLPYTLFRDGVQWLEFKEGIESNEVMMLLTILNEYRILAEEPEGDLVTALWSNPLAHIQYYQADFFWGTEPEMDFSTTPGPKATPSLSAGSDSYKSGEFESISPIDPKSLIIRPEEAEELDRMVRLEENRDPTSDFLDSMIDCLLQNKEKENFESILEAFEKEFHDSIARNDFEITQRILKSLRYVLGYGGSAMTWIRPTIEKFFASTHSARSLKPLQESLDDMNEKQMDKVRELFLLFQPEAVETLCNMLLETSSVKTQQMLMDVILILASRDFKPIEKLLNRPEESLVRKLIGVLGRIKGEGPSQMLFKMVRHSSSQVRLDALNWLLRRDPENIQKLFGLINDKSESVRRVVLNSLGQSKTGIAENFLLKYVSQKEFKNAQEAHIMACFKALGQCGSGRCIPFLKEILTGRSGLKDLLNTTIRKGAAIALKTLGTNDAIQVLEDASRSLYPNIRFAARQALQG